MLMESQVWHPPASSVGRSLRKGTMISVNTSVWENAVPQLSPWCWTIGVSLSKSVLGPFKRNCLGYQQFLSSTASTTLVFKARSYGDLSSWRWNLGLGGLVWLGPLTPEIFLPIFIHHMWVWDQPIMCLHPFYQSRCALLFNSVVVGLPFSSISDNSE